MIRSLTAALVIGMSTIALGASQANAAQIVFNFGEDVATEIPGGVQPAPVGDHVLSQHVSFTVSGSTLDALAFSSFPDPTKVAQRAGNATAESGLGVWSHNEHTTGSATEISVNEELVLDVSGLIAAGDTIDSVLLGSLQTGESANVYGTNTAPSSFTTVGLTLIDGAVTQSGSTNQQLVDLSAHQFKFYVFIASSVDFLVDALTITTPPTTNHVPEPLTLSLFGAGLAGAAALRRRRKSGTAA